MAKKALKTLFKDYTIANEKLDQVKVLHDELMQNRSETVKAILDDYGKGAFDLDGQLVMVSSRKSKLKGEDGIEVEGEARYFFKTFTQSVTKVE